jgi:hypothetical protein
LVSGKPPRRSVTLPPAHHPREAVPKYLSGRTSYLQVRLAFHLYPQVIPTVCNPSGFGPPRACSARFALPMGSSPGFGSVGRDWSPFRTRVRSGSGCPRLSLAAPNHSSAHSTKGTPSQDRSCSDRPGAHGFRRSFTPLGGVLFTVPSRYWFPIGRRRSLALGGGPPRFPPDFACRAVLTLLSHLGPCRVAYGALTRSGHPFQRCSAASWTQARGPSPPPDKSSNPRTAAPTGSCAARVWAPPRSLAATGGILSLPPGTEMFQFPGCPPHRSAVTGYHPGRVAPFGHPRIAGCQRLPGAFRRVAASFLGRRRLGIHRAPFSAASPQPAPAPRSPQDPLTGAPASNGGRRRSGPLAVDPSTRRGRACGVCVQWSWCGVAVVGGHHAHLPRPRVRGRSRALACQGAIRWPTTETETETRGGVVGWAPVEPRGFEPRTSAVQGRRSPG